MKNSLIFFVLALFPFAVSAQEVPVNLIVDLEPGQGIDLEQTNVKFLKVTADSRCPKQVTCIWAGEAKVLLGITLAGKYFEKEVVVSGTGAEFGLTKDLQVLVSHLRPYPETAKGIAPDEYCLRFIAVSAEEN